MDLKRSTKILLGIGTIWPVVYIAIFFIAIFSMIALTPVPGDPAPDPIFAVGIIAFFIVHFVTILLSLGLTVFYIVHAVKNTRLDSNMRIIWIILFFFGGMLAEPIYWYLQIWKEPEPTIGQLTQPLSSSWIDQSEVRQSTYEPPAEPPDWR